MECGLSELWSMSVLYMLLIAGNPKALLARQVTLIVQRAIDNPCAVRVGPVVSDQRVVNAR